MSTKIYRPREQRLHSVRAFRELLDNQFLILVPPVSHVLVRRYHRADVVCDDKFLSTLFVKRDRANGQRFELSLNVNFWSARNTNMQIRKVMFDEILDKDKDCFSWGWYPSIVGTLIERVHDNEKWVLSRDCEHLV